MYSLLRSYQKVSTAIYLLTKMLVKNLSLSKFDVILAILYRIYKSFCRSKILEL